MSDQNYTKVFTVVQLPAVVFDAINNRLSSIDRILGRHASPKLAVPQGSLDPQGNLDGSKDVFEVTGTPAVDEDW